METISPEIALKILQADDILLVNKALTGKGLSPEDRKRLWAIIPSEEQPYSQKPIENPPPPVAVSEVQDEEYCESIVELCDKLKIHRQSFYRWKEKGTFPQKVQGKGWPVRAIGNWVSEFKDPKGRKSKAHPAPVVVDPEKEIRTKIRGIHLAELEGSVIWVKQHKEVVAHLVDAWLEPLNRLPGTLASMLDPDNPGWVEELVQKEVKEMILEMKRAAEKPVTDKATVREKRARPSSKATKYTRFS